MWGEGERRTKSFPEFSPAVVSGLCMEGPPTSYIAQTYSILGTFQLVSLLPQLFYDFCTNLVSFCGNPMRTLNALGGPVQAFSALKEQCSLRL